MAGGIVVGCWTISMWKIEGSDFQHQSTKNTNKTAFDILSFKNWDKFVAKDSGTRVFDIWHSGQGMKGAKR